MPVRSFETFYKYLKSEDFYKILSIYFKIFYFKNVYLTSSAFNRTVINEGLGIEVSIMLRLSFELLKSCRLDLLK